MLTTITDADTNRSALSLAYPCSVILLEAGLFAEIQEAAAIVKG